MTKGQLEALISTKMVAFQREQLGRGAEGTKTYISGDMIIIRMKNVLTPAEKQLAITDQGKGLIKEIRIQLESIIRPKLEELMQNLTGAKVISIHNDISTKTGERIDMFILDCNLEERLKLD
ncbi:Na-translocating system protein MpsC family protein [Vallitalea maricola]|uniref:Uncharacterized protein n=1 Tax=Vallitalea maricola TaxID=3074433 RepID=A0ACB5UDD0_9FIRM|nr:hypothetical protein AN2V17_01680 [Vallitalea sp. AN17-2]